jgi:hypothetical protein
MTVRAIHAPSSIDVPAVGPKWRALGRSVPTIPVVQTALIPRLGEFKVSGWAVDHSHRAAATGVDIAIDRTIFPALYGGVRRDVANYFQRPEYEPTGFTAGIRADALAAGEHGLSVRVVSADGSCYSQSANVLLTVEP